MGLIITKILSCFTGGNKRLAVLVLGLDNAGKTTLLHKLKLGEEVDAIPTIGHSRNVESFQFLNVNFTLWEVGSQDKIGSLWKYYFYDALGLIFVVDSNDRERLAEARDELHRVLSKDELRGAKVLVFANKQDLPHAADMSEVVEKLGLMSLRPDQWYLQGCCSATGDGLYEGLGWLSNSLTGTA